MHVAFRILSYTRKYWLTAVTAYICLMLGLIIDLTVPQLIRKAIDDGIRLSSSSSGTGEPIDLVRNISLLLVGLTVIKGIFQFGQTYLAEFGAQGIAYDIRNDFYRHLLID
jgi:ABC-type multidrug transport system fused ATPase/permease subunit